LGAAANATRSLGRHRRQARLQPIVVSLLSAAFGQRRSFTQAAGALTAPITTAPTVVNTRAGATLAYSLAAAPGFTLPGWLSINAGTGALSGTAVAGTFQVGVILTDIDEFALVTKTETAPSSSRSRHPTVIVTRNKSADSAAESARNDEIRTAVRDAIQAGAEAAREAAVAIREAAQAAREGAQAARESATAVSGHPAPPVPPLPPMTGGKIVSGTLNGGGPDIRVTTMNGNVTLRKVDAK